MSSRDMTPTQRFDMTVAINAAQRQADTFVGMEHMPHHEQLTLNLLETARDGILDRINHGFEPFSTRTTSTLTHTVAAIEAYAHGYHEKQALLAEVTNAAAVLRVATPPQIANACEALETANDAALAAGLTADEVQRAYEAARA